MNGPFIQTHEGKAISLLEPDYSHLTLPEFAYALARINRWTGHAGAPGLGYSVAQHCVLVANHCSFANRKWGLAHDAHEAIVGDWSSPCKRAIAALGGGDAIKELDRRHMQAAARRFGLPLQMPSEIHIEDLRALVTERRDLLGDVQALPWGIPEDITPWDDVKIEPWPVERAASEWLLLMLDLGVDR